MKRTTKVSVDTQFLIGIAAGGATGGIVSSQLEQVSFIKDNPESAPLVIGGVKAAAGFYLLTKMKGSLVQGLGAGWLAEGAGDVFGKLLAPAGSVGGFRRRTLGTGYVERHNRKNRILGPADYAEMPPRYPVKEQAI